MGVSAVASGCVSNFDVLIDVIDLKRIYSSFAKHGCMRNDFVNWVFSIT